MLGDCLYFKSEVVASGYPILTCFLQGERGRALESLSPEEVLNEVIRILGLIFGQETVPSLLAHHITRWGSDPWARMSWTYMPPHSGVEDCVELAKPVGRYQGDLERVRFAGEATEADDIGTVHGAWLTGEREAIAILEEWQDQDLLRIGDGTGLEEELQALRERARIVDELREENEESSSSSSSSSSDSD